MLNKNSIKRLFLVLAGYSAYIMAPAVTRTSSDNTAFSNMALGIFLETGGPGISLSAPIHRNLHLSMSYSMLPFRIDNLKSSGPVQSVAVLPGNRPVEIPTLSSYTYVNKHVVQLTVDYSPFRQGKSIFYITGGILFQNPEPLMYKESYDTSVIDAFGVDKADYGEVKIINDSGSYWLGQDGEIASRFKIPVFGMYFGLGLGRPVPEKRVGFRAELGMPLYIGTFGYSANGEIKESPLPGLFFSTILNSAYGKTSGIFPALSLNLKLTVKLYDSKTQKQ